jgi:hypothetical protein
VSKEFRVFRGNKAFKVILAPLVYKASKEFRVLLV